MKRLEHKILYGRNITKSQTAVLNALRTLNLPEHVSRGLIIGRYINENGDLTSQPRFEYLIIFMFITTAFLELAFILCLAQGLASSGQQWSTSLALPIILTTPLSLALFYYYKLFMQNILIISKRKIELKNIFESQKLIGITTLGKKPKVSTLN